MVGARLFGPCTVIENAGSERVTVPSLTLMTMFEYVAILAVRGVPLSRPFVVLKAAHDGRLEIEKRTRSPSGSLALGVKL
jgi:hypothetical protein